MHESIEHDLVVGATGLVGNQLVRLLLEAGRHVRVLVRREFRVDGEYAGKLDVRLVNFDELSGPSEASSPFAGVTRVYSCLGTTIKQAGSQAAFRKVDHDYTLRVAELAASAGAKQLLLVSALGADPNSSVFYNQVKGETEQALNKLGLMSLVSLRPSLLLGERSERRFGESVGTVVAKGIGWSLVGPLRRYRAIEASVVARAMLRISTQPAFAAGTHAVESEQIASLGC